MDVLVGTAEGLHTLGGPTELDGRDVTHLAVDGARLWALLDGREVQLRHNGSWTSVGTVGPHAATCLLPHGDGVVVGTEEAHLVEVTPEAAHPDEAFDDAPGREKWYTPWGGPPDVRSLARDAGGTVFVNVHVGGILRRGDDGWEATGIDIDADVHQVTAHPSRPGVLLAAAAVGVAASTDGGEGWHVDTDGLHATYSRAVVLCGETVIATASVGPHGGRAAVYRKTLGTEGFERCTDGLPEWFDENVDTHWLAASGEAAVFADADGRVYRSADAGASWEEAVSDLPRVRCVALAP